MPNYDSKKHYNNNNFLTVHDTQKNFFVIFVLSYLTCENDRFYLPFALRLLHLII